MASSDSWCSISTLAGVEDREQRLVAFFRNEPYVSLESSLSIVSFPCAEADQFQSEAQDLGGEEGRSVLQLCDAWSSSLAIQDVHRTIYPCS